MKLLTNFHLYKTHVRCVSFHNQLCKKNKRGYFSAPVERDSVPELLEQFPGNLLQKMTYPVVLFLDDLFYYDFTLS